MKTAATSAGDAASRSRRIRARETPARKPDAARAVRAPLRDAADHAIILTFSESAEREVEHPNRETPNNLSPALSVYPRGYVRPGNAGLFHWKSNTMKTTNTSRKAQTAAAKSATDTTTDATTSELERKYPTVVTAEQRKERAARFKNHAEKAVEKMSGHDRALLDAAADAAGMTAAEFVAAQVVDERGLGKRRDLEAQTNLKVDDGYETETARTRNNHERQEVRAIVAVFGNVDAAGLTHAEKVEVVRRYFRKDDRNLDVATGRAIKDALALPSPDRMTRAEIEIEAAARIVGKTADEFIADALHTAINSAKDRNGGEQAALALAPKTNEKDAEPITYADSGEALTIRISGTAYANLATMAKTMNGVAWCDKDNTPATVASAFVFGDTFENLAKPTRMSGKFIVGGCGEIAADICDCIDTGCDCETDEHERRCAELQTALLAALPTA